jgi:hypothetical protein
MNQPKAFIGMRGFQANLTPNAAFNRKADVVMTGSVYSNVQSSTHIRPREQLECNGHTVARAYLQEFDLDVFGYKLQEMNAVRRYIKNDPYFETHAAIAYRFFHYVGDDRVIHGVIVTDSEHRLLRRFDREDLAISRSSKSAGVLDFCLPHVSHQAPMACATA